MAGNVDESGQLRIRLQCGIQIAEVDGHAALALFAAPVTRLTGQRLEQRRFAMVDMPRGADNHPARPSTCN
ncbi:hypothetical protein D3C84_1249370 [compost metagenome]